MALTEKQKEKITDSTCCVLCNLRVTKSEHASLEYIKTKRHSELFAHTRCILATTERNPQ